MQHNNNTPDTYQFLPEKTERTRSEIFDHLDTIVIFDDGFSWSSSADPSTEYFFVQYRGYDKKLREDYAQVVGEKSRCAKADPRNFDLIELSEEDATIRMKAMVNLDPATKLSTLYCLTAPLLAACRKSQGLDYSEFVQLAGVLLIYDAHSCIGHLVYAHDPDCEFILLYDFSGLSHIKGIMPLITRGIYEMNYGDDSDEEPQESLGSILQRGVYRNDQNSTSIFPIRDEVECDRNDVNMTGVRVPIPKGAYTFTQAEAYGQAQELKDQGFQYAGTVRNLFQYNDIIKDGMLFVWKDEFLDDAIVPIDSSMFTLRTR